MRGSFPRPPGRRCQTWQPLSSTTTFAAICSASDTAHLRSQRRANYLLHDRRPAHALVRRRLVEQRLRLTREPHRREFVCHTSSIHDAPQIVNYVRHTAYLAKTACDRGSRMRFPEVPAYPRSSDFAKSRPLSRPITMPRDIFPMETASLAVVT